MFIKQILSIATAHKMSASFSEKNIEVDFFVDSLKYDKSRIEDLQSTIQTVNHHF